MSERDEWSDLEDAARAATPGPWIQWDDGDVGTAYPVIKQRPNRRRPHMPVSYVRVESDHIANTYEADGAFIAMANPDAVLGLIAALRLERDRNAN